MCKGQTLLEQELYVAVLHPVEDFGGPPGRPEMNPLGPT
jgi:hypothetical protein